MGLDRHLFLFCLLKPLLLGGLRGNSSVYGATSYVKTLIVFDQQWDERGHGYQYKIINNDFFGYVWKIISFISPRKSDC